jgi:hypothetical protein
MITGVQIRAARALLGIDQRVLAERAGLSLPTIQRMESSGGIVRGNVDSLTKVIYALEEMGVDVIGEGSTSATGGRGVRLRGREDRQNTNSDVSAPVNSAIRPVAGRASPVPINTTRRLKSRRGR